MNRWSDQGFMPTKQLKGEPNQIKHWPIKFLHVFLGAYDSFYHHKWQKKRAELRVVCIYDRSASLSLVHLGTRMLDLLLTGKCLPVCVWGHPCVVTDNDNLLSLSLRKSSVGVNMCLCIKTHTLSGVAIQCGRWFVKGVCIPLGIGWHFGTHTTLFAFAWRLVWTKVFALGKTSPFPWSQKGQKRRDRIGQDKTWNDMTRKGKHKCVQAGEDQIGQDRTN